MTSRNQPRRRKRKLKVKRLVALIAIVVILIGGIVGFIMYSTAQKPVDGNDTTIVYFNIESGTGSSDVIDQMAQEGLIRDALMTKIYARLNNQTAFCAGTFELSRSMDLDTILTTLNDPSSALTNTVSVTLVEGDWVKHMAERIGGATNVSADELLASWNDESYVRLLMSDYPFLTEEIFNGQTRYLLEGYLFPDTYEFYVDTTVDEITRKLLDNTLSVYNTLSGDLEASGFTIHQWFTLASIVQYEASKPDDMKLVASVFENRLEAGMPLQSSVTVCYALDVEKDDDWQLCEVNPTYDSPYNTYMVQGLPPGPILNPGYDALDAVLHPTESNYYYFMADVYGDGTVYFSETLDQHEALVNQYLR